MDFDFIVGIFTIASFLFTVFLEWPRAKQRLREVGRHLTKTGKHSNISKNSLSQSDKHLTDAGTIFGYIEGFVTTFSFVSFFGAVFLAVLVLIVSELFGLESVFGIKMQAFFFFLGLGFGVALIGMGITSFVHFWGVIPYKNKQGFDFNNSLTGLIIGVSFIGIGGFILRWLAASGV